MPRLPHTLPLLLALLALGPGCSTARIQELTAHAVDIRDDTLSVRSDVAPLGSRVPIDLLVLGYEGLSRPFLDAFVDALDRSPALAVTRIAARGHEASRCRRRSSASPAALRVDLGCRPRFTGRVANAFIAFPGMIPFLPVFLGYGYDLVLDVEATVLEEGRRVATVLRRVEAFFRVRNSPRSRFFHLWPSTGILGTQFVLGLILAPIVIPYDDSAATTRLVAQALEPRLGRIVVRDIAQSVLRTAGATRR